MTKERCFNVIGWNLAFYVYLSKSALYISRNEYTNLNISKTLTIVRGISPPKHMITVLINLSHSVTLPLWYIGWKRMTNHVVRENNFVTTHLSDVPLFLGRSWNHMSQSHDQIYSIRFFGPLIILNEMFLCWCCVFFKLSKKWFGICIEWTNINNLVMTSCHVTVVRITFPLCIPLLFHV